MPIQNMLQGIGILIVNFPLIYLGIPPNKNLKKLLGVVDACKITVQNYSYHGPHKNDKILYILEI